MKRIHLLTTNNTPNSLAFNLPLQVHENLLRDINLDVALFFSVKPSLFECDLLMVNSKNFRDLWAEHSEQIFKFLADAKNKVKAVLWCDTADSTGTTQFDVLPYVDGYYKTIALKDRRLYLREYIGHRIFAHYYYTNYALEPEAVIDTFRPAKESELHKIHVSWHSGMGDYGQYAKWHQKLRSYIPLPPTYSARFIPVNRLRKKHISCRVGINHRSDAVRLHRQMTIDCLQEKYNISTTKISRRKFFDELQDCKIAVSPFGWGEITLRDFEIMINGAALAKPDMSHVDTWPPIYQPEITYIPYKWDLSDLPDQLDKWLENDH